MDKTVIKNFAIWARNRLIADIKYRASFMGITENGITKALPQSTKTTEFYDIGTADPYVISGEKIKQRRKLVEEIEKKERDSNYALAYQDILEEVAYTWFNRLIAIRFMEVNDYLPSHVRVLSSESGKLEPDLVTTPFEAEIEFTPEETEHIIQMKNDNDVDELFCFLFIKQCNALSKILPDLFEQTSDYTELLLNVSVTDQEGIVYRLVHDIEESNFNISNIGETGTPTGQVEIIGWMYQYYNTELKEDTFAKLKKNIKITKERIPAATQLFTPDWIVRYMVENSVGRIWIEHLRAIDAQTDEKATAKQFGWNYYLPEAIQEESVNLQLAEIRKDYKDLQPTDIKCIDPCMGSGHILIAMFDVLMDIYTSVGYSERDAAFDIVEHNIYGLDIDKRAYQLAYFAVMMKGRGYNRRFFRGKENVRPVPKVYAIMESNEIEKQQIQFFGKSFSERERKTAVEQIEYLFHTFEDAREYGSILNVDACDWKLLKRFVEDLDISGQISFDNMGSEETQEKLRRLISIAEVISQNYEVVVTNPPYMGASNMNVTLNKFIKDNYKDYKSDFFSAFIIKCSHMAKSEGYLGFLTPYVWMFIQSYENLRMYLYTQATIEKLIQFEYSAFEEATVPICTFVFKNSYVNKKGCYLRLTEFRGGMEVQRQKTLEAIENHQCGFYYEQSTDNFSKIPGSPVAYWVSEVIFGLFQDKTLNNYYDVKAGMCTGANAVFILFWHEVDYRYTYMHSRKNYLYVAHNKGGEYRKWYGNRELVLKYNSKALKEMHKNKGFRYDGKNYYFKEHIGWSKITSSKSSFRYFEEGFTFDSAGLGLFGNFEQNIYMTLGFLNSKIAEELIALLNPTLNVTPMVIKKLPYTESELISIVEQIVKNNIEICKLDWDSFETSWDFTQHPLIRCASFSRKEMQEDRENHIKDKNYIKDAFTNWENECFLRFQQLKSNEEELNHIFIDIYGLQDELTPEVEEKEVTVRKADLGREIRSFISYAVGCMFGRYSLDREGLLFAGGDIKDTYAYYDGTIADTANNPINETYTVEQLGTPFYYLPVDGKQPLECWKVDADNVIPITEEEYFSDDIVGRFVEFVKMVYGEDTLEDNLDFIGQALGNKGDSSREIIRNYFLKDFFADHLKVYQKRPIYWLFDSGKQHGCKALIYMHRYNKDTIGKVRVDYLHHIEGIYESEINRMQDTMDNSKSSREIAVATKRKEKLQKQLKECREYDEKIGHLALLQIEIDLDDGVKINYEKVQTASDGKKYQVLAKI